MKKSTRIQELLKRPSYRLRLGFFVVIGVLLIVVLFKAPIDSAWRDIGLNIAATFIGVGLVSILWDFLGGDPIELKIDAVQRTTQVLSDMNDGNIGIVRIWPSRAEWEADESDGIKVWRERVCQADEVDIVSNTFYNGWAKKDDFIKDLFKSIRKGAKFRLLIYDPNSTILNIRSKHENDPREEKTFEMQMEINSTIRKLAGIWNELGDKQNHLEISLTQEYYHLAQIIRADDQMVISFYLSRKSGSPCPTIQVAGTESVYFKTYAEQFNILWDGKIGDKLTVKRLTPEDFHNYLKSRNSGIS